MIELGNRLELFVDHFLIDRLDRTSLKLHHPQRANVAMTMDKPWEGGWCGYSTVILDGGVYHFIYRGWPTIRDNSEGYYCYARSDDGITFERPTLKMREFEGSTTNNIFLTGDASHSFSPFLDTKPGVPDDQRYKAFGLSHEGKKPVLSAWVSPDLINWQKIQDEPVITEGAFDSQNVGFWSEHEGCYLAYYRTWNEATAENVYGGKRVISRAKSDDFINWSPGELMTYGDVPVDQLYTNQTHAYFRAPHIYIALPKRFTPGRKTLSDAEVEQFGISKPYDNDVSDGMLMTSRGGSTYDRTFMQAFVRPGPDRANWVSRTNMSTLNIVPTGEREMSLYYHHRYGSPSHYLQRFTLRTDGFASLNAPWDGGEMVTKPLTFTGSTLELNYDTSGPGGIKVELQDESGSALEGFGLDDCDEVFGDELARTVTWGGNSDLSSVAGKPVRLRFRMVDADVYSLRFA